MPKVGPCELLLNSNAPNLLCSEVALEAPKNCFSHTTKAVFRRHHNAVRITERRVGNAGARVELVTNTKLAGFTCHSTVDADIITVSVPQPVRFNGAHFIYGVHYTSIGIGIT